LFLNYENIFSNKILVMIDNLIHFFWPMTKKPISDQKEILISQELISVNYIFMV
jgi:hypothetical protein